MDSSIGRMTCREVIEFLDAYLAGELAPAQCAAFDQHIAGCAACIAYIKSYKQTLDLTKAAFDEPAAESEEIPDELVDAIIAARKREGA